MLSWATSDDRSDYSVILNVYLLLWSVAKGGKPKKEDVKPPGIRK
jgi:hypothetical protein